MGRQIVQMQQIRRIYLMGQEEVVALNGVDVEIVEGQSVAIMGASGSGKSTLLHLMGCLDRLDGGSYHFCGHDTQRMDDEALSLIRSESIGFVFQAYNLIPQLTVMDNVLLPFSYRRRVPLKAYANAKEALERVGLSHRLQHKPGELSGGEMQRVAIARALVVGPKLILADEPTGNLDSENEERVLDLFDELHAEGKTIVMVTHDESVAKRCSRLIQMRDGKVVSDVA